jgi:hypothetical protein
VFIGNGRVLSSPQDAVFLSAAWLITMNNLPEENTYTVFIARVNRDFIISHRGATTLIPIGQYPKLTASPLPAVSSLEAYQTPAS